MNGYESGSKPSSSTTSASGRSSTTGKSGSEAEFLREQAEQAKAAIKVALDRTTLELRNAADVRAWTHEHPWIMTASAAVAGFVAATMIVPSKEEQALKRIAEVERATASYPPPEQDGHEARARRHPPRSFWSGLALEALEAIKPAVLSALTAGVTAKVARPSHEEMKAAVAQQQQEQQSGHMPPDHPFPPRQET